MDKNTYLNVGLALLAGAAGYAAYAAWSRPSSNAVMVQRLKTKSGTGTTDIPVTKPNLGGEVFASLKLSKKPSSTVLPVTAPPSTPSSKPIVVRNRITKKPPNGVLRPGPNWNAWNPPVRPLNSSNGGDFVSIVESVLNKKQPSLKGGPNVVLAQAIVNIAFQERFPLDLLLAWVGVEGNFLSQTSPNKAGAIGPVQMTEIAFKDLGLSFPGPSTLERLRAGVRYFRLLRSKYPECASSLTATFRTYGMGWGGYTAFKAACDNGIVTRTSSLSVWKREAGSLSRSYTGMLFAYAKLPLLHTMDWGAL